MCLVVGGYVDGKLNAIGISCLLQKLFCLLDICAGTIDIIEIDIVIGQRRKHCSADDLTVSTRNEFICAILVKCIADCLTHLHVVQGLHRIVQEKCLYNVGGCSQDLILILEFLRLGIRQIRKHVNGMTLQLHQCGVRAGDDLEGHFVKVG